MYETFLDLLTTTSDFLWGPWTMAFIAGVSVFLTVKARGFQLFRLWFILSQTLGQLARSKDEVNDDTVLSKTSTGVTAFQATTTSLAGTVGMGNMAGVATALSVGGPGAIFWMWVLAFFGMITKTAEVTLAVHYRETGANGEIRGGPMYYIQKGLGWKSLALVFSFGILVNSLFSASMLQAHTVGRAFSASYEWSPYLVTTVMAVITAFVAIGGVQRIGRFCEVLVPLMTVVYLLAGALLVSAHASEIPSVLGEIFNYAFAPAPAAGGFAGAVVRSAIQTGMARGMLSNEAGLGTAPLAHANAQTKHPFKQGLWGACEVFIDTTIVCSITALAILTTGVLSSGATGIELLLLAFGNFYPTEFASAFVSATIFVFCLTTQIGFFIYFRTALVHLVGEARFRYLKWVYFLPGVAFAGVTEVDKLWAAANISVVLSALPNLVAVLMLSGVFFTLMKDYLSGECRFATAVTDRTGETIRQAK